MLGFILAGGYGSRLYPLTLNRPNKPSLEKGIPKEIFNVNALPKPLVPITNCPMIHSSLSMLKTIGVEKTYILTGYLHDQFEKYFQSSSGIILYYLNNPYGTVNNITNLVLEEINRGFRGDVAVLSGDIVSDIDSHRAFGAHLKHRATTTIVTTPITASVKTCSPVATENPQNYDSRVTAYFHKYPVNEALKISSNRNSSIYFFNHTFFQAVRKNFSPSCRLDFSTDIFPWILTQKDMYFLGCNSHELWADVGEINTYWDIQGCNLEKQLNFPIFGRYFDANKTYDENGHKVTGPSLLPKECEIGRGSKIGPYAIIGEGWQIGSKVRIYNSVLWPVREDRGVLSNLFKVRSKTAISNSVIGSGIIDRHIDKKIVVSNGEKTFFLDFEPQVFLSREMHPD